MKERPDFLRVKQIVERTGLSKAKVHALLAQGRLDAVRLDGTLLIRMDSYERLISDTKPFNGAN